ncbi:polysaccharide pyruvyl transferase family protein [Bradyrhizobium yuanmingense]|uniref:polysaccharide pyruvyl transferase family protein n=1 Tax=Bradyrhizobium yuanmingense TaxID=108015 RepID=UPI0023B9972B|nr:polysaccharide pyruvyl transferase family protein [Bradyrhizobium yuanmingense]MDF0578883.1 polysaccharide pyruvyl transferase family protein [Bradyrhizobium yuanmingense]
MGFEIEALQAEVERQIVPLISSVQPHEICLIDPPQYNNVGDIAIFLGEMQFLRKNFPRSNIRLIYRNNYRAFSQKIIENCDLILLQGGGNFGDIWRHFHDFRLDILRRYPHKPIIQFPQSIHFSNTDYLAETQKAISACKQFYLMARDRNTHAYAQEQFQCDIRLCPDMAFSLGPLHAGKAMIPLFCLFRTDKEVLESKNDEIGSYLRKMGVKYKIEDWPDLGGSIELSHNLIRFASFIPIIDSSTTSRLSPLYLNFAKSRMDYGLSLLRQGQSVATDRLHGMILATLLGKRRFVFDSWDSKVRHFADTWLSTDEKLHIVNSVSDFKDIVARDGI